MSLSTKRTEPFDGVEVRREDRKKLFGDVIALMRSIQLEITLSAGWSSASSIKKFFQLSRFHSRTRLTELGRKSVLAVLLFRDTSQNRCYFQEVIYLTHSMALPNQRRQKQKGEKKEKKGPCRSCTVGSCTGPGIVCMVGRYDLSFGHVMLVRVLPSQLWMPNEFLRWVKLKTLIDWPIECYLTHQTWFFRGELEVNWGMLVWVDFHF